MSKRKHTIPRSHIIISTVVAVLLLAAGYFINESNSFLFWNEEQLSYSRFQNIRGQREADEKVYNDNVLFVDVSNIKTLLKRSPCSKDPLDCPDTIREVITDRKVLLEFLRKVDSLPIEYRYKYLFLDVFFEKGDSTQYDADLVKQLKRMKNVAIAKRNGKSIIDNNLDSIAFFTFYYHQTYDNRFAKYDYILKGENSIGLELYKHATNHTIKKYGLLYFDGWRLAHNSNAIPFFHEQDINHPPRVYIDKLLTDSSEWNRFTNHIGGSYVIVGDLEHDKACTYLGNQPGPVIQWIGFLYLMSENHKVNPLCVLILFIFYFSLTLLILNNSILPSFLLRNPVVHLLSSLVGFGVLFLLLSLVIYIVWGILYSTLLPTIVFPLISNYKQYKKNNDKKKGLES